MYGLLEKLKNKIKPPEKKPDTLREKVINYLLMRLHEGTTWVAIFSVFAALGFQLSAAQTASIAALFMILLPNKIDIDD